MTRNNRKPSRFPDTRWSMVKRAASSDELTRRQAMTDLLVTYTPALRTFLVEARRVPPDIADDVLQDFIADKILSRKLIRHADQNKGKFRNYLLKSLNNFTTTKLKREYAQRAQGVVLDEASLADPESRQKIDRFEHEWVQTVVQDALKLMEKDCLARSRSDIWEIFRMRFADPLLRDEEPVGYEHVVKCLGIQTPRQAINLLATAKRCFIRHLREAISRYVGSEEKIDEEFADLLEIVGR